MPTPTHRSAREDAASLAEGWLQVVSTRHADPRTAVHRHGVAASGSEDRGEDVDRAKPGLELVLLDMDGTLVDGSSWEMVHEAFGTSNQANWERYQRGELDDVEFMRSDIALWHVGANAPRKHVADVERALHRAPLMPGVHELARGLRERGIATCILSGGIDILARKLCDEVGFDMYVANGLRLMESGHLAGDGIVYVEIRDKARVAREILKKLGVPKERTASVGNSAFDVPMFRETGMGICVNPSDRDVIRGATRTVYGKDLRPVLELLLAAR